nr:MAG TPA: hypothetical protein [Caudoviricetes sp.]
MHFPLRKEGDNYVNCIYRVSSSWSISGGRHCGLLDVRSTRLVFASRDCYCRMCCARCAYLLGCRLCGCVGRARRACLLDCLLGAGDLRDLENRVSYSFCEYHMRVTIINDIL